MKFIVERDAFDAALRSIISRTKNNTIPIFSHVLVTAEGRAVTLASNDTASCCTDKIAADVDHGGAIALPAERLARLVGDAPKGAQVMVALDGSRATVKCGRGSYTFGTLPAEDFPGIFAVEDGVTFTFSKENAATAFKTPASSILDSQARPYLGGIHLTNDDGRLKAVATDGHTLICMSLPFEVKGLPPVIVPKSALSELIAVVGKGEAEISLSENLISARSSGRCFVSKLIEGTFPHNWRGVIPQRCDAPIIVDAREIDSALARLSAAHDPDQAAVVRLAWRGDQHLEISLRSSLAQGIETIDCEHAERGPGEIGLQLDYMRKILAAADAEIVHLHIHGPGEPMRVEAPSVPEFVAAIMPCRF